MPSTTELNPPEQFDKALVDALKHYNDPQWLGQHSPLATPYFLGHLLEQAEQPGSVPGRGRGLQRAIYQAAATIWPGELPQSRKSLLKLVENERAEEPYGPRYLFLLLDLRYLRRFFLPSSAPNTVGAMYDILNVSETRFFAHLQKARHELAEALLRVTRPSLRLESPLQPLLIGRDDLLERVRSDLAQNWSVTLSGQAGIGKTSLGAYLAQNWSSGPVFWHTFRPGLNDDLASVVFGLAHFLYQHGCSSLWLQLMANETVLENLELLAGFLREDLECAARLPVLLCFDELDLLHTSKSQPRHGVHKQILELLESLQGLAPLLLIGQKGIIDTSAHYELQPLTKEGVQALLQHKAVETQESIAEIQQLTGGNPRFLEIYIALRKSLDPLKRLDLGQSPSVKPLFNRLWKRLDEAERDLLMALSIFRSMTPQDAWRDHGGLQSLQQRSLLKFDARGGVALLSIFRELVHDELPEEQRRLLHQDGALIRSQRGQYTEAAHHLWQAGQFETAVQLWYEHQAVEIEQGKAGAAYALFNQARPPKLPEKAGKQLKVIRDRLSLLHGDAASVLQDIDSYSWHLDEKITAEALEQWGQAHFIRGDIDAALSDYEEAISVLGELSKQTVLLHRRRVQSFIERAEIDLAERETRLAQFELAWQKALIDLTQGKFRPARDHLQEARQLAMEASDDRRVAEADRFLAMAAGNYGDYGRAQQHAQAAMAYYKQTGDRLNLENMRAELAGFYLNEGKFAEAIEPLEAALSFFERINHDLRIAHITSDLAEAYFETGRLDLAENYALRAFQSENPRVLPYACYTLGQIRYEQERFADAEHVFQTGIQFTTRSGDDFIAAYLYRAYGELLCRENRVEEGLASLKRAADIFLKMEMTPEVQKTGQLIGSCDKLE
jgi:tetratricopeptide (TPR) repeat protein